MTDQVAKLFRPGFERPDRGQSNGGFGRLQLVDQRYASDHVAMARDSNGTRIGGHQGFSLHDQPEP